MRRQVVERIRCSLLRSFSFLSLFKAQSALKSGSRPTNSEAESFATFFRVPTSSTGVAKSVRQYVDRLLRETEDQQDSLAVRLQEQAERRREELPVFLLSYDLRSKIFHIFSVSSDRVVLASPLNPADAESPTLADELMQHTHGVTQVVLIPLAAHESERSLLAPHLTSLSDELRRSGLIPVSHVDNLELAEALDPDPPPMREVVANYAAITPKPLSDAWFRAHWVYLRTLACRASDEDPTQTINGLIVPRYDVFIIHLVRTGSRALNVALWDPVHRRRYAAKGMLSDVLACLLERYSKRIIFIPTNRTDRPTLLRCRTALTKAGRRCHIVFPSEMGERYRAVFHSDPGRYWASLRDASGALDADLLFNVYAAAGKGVRAFHKQRHRDGGQSSSLLPRPDMNSMGVTGAEVEKWLSVLSLERRVARERAEMRKYKRYLLVAYIATEFASHTRPANPHVQSNHVIAACLMDGQQQIVEPWAKYTKRGDFRFPTLDEFDVLVCHDAKQLLLLLWDDPALQRFLNRGGRVWCTMLAEYLLEAQRCQTGANSFRDVALKYGVVTPPSSVLGVVTVDLPFAFLRRHLLVAVEALSAVFNEQLRRSLERSQTICITCRMDALLCMASMEQAGIQIDVDEAVRQAQAVRNRSLAIEKALSLYVPTEVPLDLRRQFDWTSLQHLSAFFFGGSITLGYMDSIRESPVWTSNLVQFCHKYGNLALMPADVHLQRFASAAGLSTTGRLPQRVGQYLDSGGIPSRQFRLVVCDVESTGLNTATDDIIEIAAWDPFEDSSFSSLVNPRRPIPPRTIAIHHITDGMVRSAPLLPEVTRAFVRYLRLDDPTKSDEVVVLIGHNVFALDEPLLRRALASEGVDLDRILFCDSLAMLKSLKRELLDTKSNQRVDRRTLEILTTSLRLSALVQGLRVRASGEMHRAETDTKTLWFVLVNALGLAGRTPAKQRDAIFSHAARTFAAFPGVGCFLATERRRDCVTVQLPGAATSLIQNASKLASLKNKMLNEAVLESLQRHGVEAAGLVLQKEQLERSAARFLHSGPDGQLTVLHDDKRVRQYIDMCATTTSRTTSSYPSCQNIPKDDKSSLRSLFVSRFGSDGRCVELDYSQLEIAIMALLCGDKRLTTDLNNGIDFHVKRAEFFSGLPYKDIFEGYKRGVPRYVKLRKTAKIFTFQRLYGAGVPLLHKTTGISVADLEASIRREEEEYPGISLFHRLVRTVALRTNNPGLPTHFIFELPTGLRMGFKTRDVVLNLPPVKNYPIQGFGAELAQIMMGRVFRQFVRKNYYGGKAFMTNFVHDSLWLDCHVDVLEECVRETRACLSETHTYVEKMFPGVVLKVPLHVTVQCGLDMCSMENVDDDFSFVVSQQQKKKKNKTSEVEDVPVVDEDAVEIIEINL